MSKKEKLENFVEKNGVQVVTALSIFSAIGIGYVFGSKMTSAKLNSGLAMIFKENPEIEPLVNDAIKSLKSKN